MRVVTWNCRGALASSKVWDYLFALEPDVALLQEVGAIPDVTAKGYQLVSRIAKRKDGKAQGFATSVLARTNAVSEFSLSSTTPWVQRELEWFHGNLVGCVIQLGRYNRLHLLSVYSPAWAVDKLRIAQEDTSKVKLTLNEDVWVTDLLRSSLVETFQGETNPWIIAGDFNLSETFDSWPGGPRGNREYLDRMEALGLTECLRKWQGKLTATFMNTDKKTHKHQIDHLFVTSELANALSDCVVGDQLVFQEGLSDHLPIVADFRGTS
jgi:exonuclease III